MSAGYSVAMADTGYPGTVADAGYYDLRRAQDGYGVTCYPPRTDIFQFRARVDST